MHLPQALPVLQRLGTIAVRWSDKVSLWVLYMR
jgi:hypothetical protein